ncbi:MAG: hypothetical protein JNM59_01160 [Hyphomonadaceae bacterium]|nr:hypothetical protein [Hyphomonadaceae bacterium]
MAPAPAPALSLTRLSRLHTRLFLTLVWFVGALWRALSNGEALTPRALHRHLDALARAVGQLASLHARSRVHIHAARQQRHGRVRRSGLVRAVVGARVRRAMRGPTWAQRLFAILAFMRDIAAHADRLARRLRRGLTRRRAVPPKPESTQRIAWFSVAATASNTS